MRFETSKNLLGASPLRVGLPVAAACAAAWLCVAAAQAQAPRITPEKLLEYVLLEVNENKLVRLVENAPGPLTLSPEEIAQLRAAGAGDALLRALRARSKALAPTVEIANYVLVLDCSGTMNDKGADGRVKWDAAKDAMIQLVTAIPEGRNVACVLFGHRPQLGGEAVEVARPLIPMDAAAKKECAEVLAKLRPAGPGALAEALEKAGAELAGKPGLSRVVVITDGVASAGGDPAAVAERLARDNPNLRGGVTVIGLSLDGAERKQAAQVATASGGKFYPTASARELTAALREVEASLVQLDDGAAAASPRENADAEEVVVSVETGDVLARLADADRDTRLQAVREVRQNGLRQAAPLLVSYLHTHDTHLNEHYVAPDQLEAFAALRAVAPDQTAAALTRGLAQGRVGLRRWCVKQAVELELRELKPALEARLAASNLDASYEAAEVRAALARLSGASTARENATFGKEQPRKEYPPMEKTRHATSDAQPTTHYGKPRMESPTTHKRTIESCPSRQGAAKRVCPLTGKAY